MATVVIVYKATCHLESAGRELHFVLEFVLYDVNNCWKEGENGREKKRT